MWVAVALFVSFAIGVYMHTGNNSYPRRGARQWLTYWLLVAFVMVIPTIVITREFSAAAGVTAFFTLPFMLVVYYRNKANRLRP